MDDRRTILVVERGDWLATEVRSWGLRVETMPWPGGPASATAPPDLVLVDATCEAGNLDALVTAAGGAWGAASPGVLVVVSCPDDVVRSLKAGAQDAAMRAEGGAALKARVVAALRRAETWRHTPHADDGHRRVRGETSLDVRRELRERDERMAMLLHDMRTPLTAVIASLDLAVADSKRRGVEPSVGVELASEAASHLLEMANDLVLASQLEAVGAATALVRERLDPVCEVRRAASRITAEAMLRECWVEWDVRGRGLAVSADRLKLQRVLDNLLSNAVGHASVGTCVRVRVEERPGRVVITVTNEGPGVPAELMERVFEPYFTTRGDRGMNVGLGLRVCRLVVEAHGGQIWVAPGAEGGVTLGFWLPSEDTEVATHGTSGLS